MELKVAGIGTRQRKRRGQLVGQGGFPRHFLNGGSREASRDTVRERGTRTTVLDRFNDRQESKFLHPTKGWRTVNPKRMVAQRLMAEIRAGWRSPTARLAAELEAVS